MIFCITLHFYLFHTNKPFLVHYLNYPRMKQVWLQVQQFRTRSLMYISSSNVSDRWGGKEQVRDNEEQCMTGPFYRCSHELTPLSCQHTRHSSMSPETRNSAGRPDFLLLQVCDHQEGSPAPWSHVVHDGHFDPSTDTEFERQEFSTIAYCCMIFFVTDIHVIISGGETIKLF